jgi:adenylate cyclase
MRMTGRQRSRFNPQFCVKCQQFEHPGGAEVALTMIFADVRGSTELAESMSPSEFTRLINRFYVVATDILVRSDGLVDRLMGDEVVGLFVPGFAGPTHPRRAIDAAKALLVATGHAHPGGPWVPVGIGINTGTAFVGVVGGDGGSPQDFTALGDNVNITARLAAQAGVGEILISEATAAAAGLPLRHVEHRDLQLKGKSAPVGTHVITITADQ